MRHQSLLKENLDSLKQSLSVFPLCKGFTGEQLGLLAEYCAPITFQKGKVIFEQGTRRDSLYLITKGRLSVYKEFGDEPEVFAVLNPGEFCCEEALSDPDAVHSKSGQALEDLEVLALSHTAFQGLAKENPSFALLVAERILKTIAERLHHADNKLVTLYHTGRIISITLPLEDIASQILAALHEVIKARRSLFAVFSRENSQVSVMAQHGFASSPFKEEQRLSLEDDPVFGVIARNKSTLLVNAENATDDMKKASYATDSMLGAPIIHNGEAIGAILMLDKQDEDFNINNVILAEIVARQIAGAVSEADEQRRKKAEEELKQVYIRPF